MENNLTLNLHPNELDYIAKCLHRQPYGDVAPLLAKIQSQVIQQQMAEQVEREQSQQAATDRDMVDRPQRRAALCAVEEDVLTEGSGTAAA